jgi:hypothetical protein
MTTALAEAPQQEPVSAELLNFPECTFTTTGLIIPEGMPFDRWLALGAALRKAGKGIQFWIGDWIRYGEHEYGEMYSQAIEATGKAEATLQNYVFVAKNVHSSRRRELDVVDFSTHAEVASLPAKDQERILAAAEKDTLTVKQVRREVHRTMRQMGKKKSELEILHTKDVQQFLDGYVDHLKELEASVPLTASFLRNMVQAHIGQAQWQKERTIAADCEVILEAIDEYNGISDDDLFTWLQNRGYFMRDPELDERLEYMKSEGVKLITETDAGHDGKQDARRGKLPTFYVRYYKKRPKMGVVSAEDDDE